MLSQQGPWAWEGWGGDRQRRTVRVPPAELHMVVPAQYWETERPKVVPLEQLHVYHQDLNTLYASATTAPTQAGTVPINYYRRTATYLAMMVSGSPPEIEGDEAPAWVPVALHDMVLDWTVHGTGSGYVMDGRWYPLDPSRQYLGPEGTVWAVELMDPVLGADRQGLRLLTLMDDRVVQMATGAADNMEGRVADLAAPEDTALPLLHVRRQPILTRWHGQSMYLDMEPLVEEVQSRYGLVSEVLDTHSNPILMLKRSAMKDPELDNFDGSQADGGTVKKVKIGERGRGLILDEDFDDGRYLSWDPQMQASDQHIKRLEDSLYSATSLPAALQAADRGVVASGVAMKKLYAPAYMTLKVLQRDLRRTLAAALGVPGDAIEWPHPFDLIDTQPENTQGAPGVPEVNPDGGAPEFRLGEES